MPAVLNKQGKILNNLQGEAFSLLNVYEVGVCTCVTHQVHL